MSRRRLALFIAAFALIANFWVDYRLLIRNPTELEAQARTILHSYLPNFAPSFGAGTEFQPLTGQLVLFDVVFHEQGDLTKELFRVPRLEVELSGIPPPTLSLTAIEPEILLRHQAVGISYQGQPVDGLTEMV